MELLTRVALAALLTGCSAPSLDGRFACAADGACPPGLRCASDRICRRVTVAGVDAAQDPTHDLAPMDAATCQKRSCTNDACGQMLDGCGGKVACGPCNGPMKTCGAAGPNLCGTGMCKPTSCDAQDAKCGLVSDGCAAVLDCGPCDDGQQCGDDHLCH